MNNNGTMGPLKFVDTHAHIFLKEFDSDRKEIIRKSAEAGVQKILMPNLDHTSIDAMLEAEEKHPECMPMMGLHPCYVKKDFEKDLYLVEDWLGKKKFVAVGEVGIDLYWDTTFLPQQEEALKVQISLAKKYSLPLVVHCRNSFTETIALLERTGTDIKGVFHCFSGTIEEARRAIAFGFKLGIGGVITFKNGGLDKIIDQVEMEHLILETDSPYLTPAPHRKLRNDPSYIPFIAARLAELKKISVEEVAIATTKNAEKLFNIHVSCSSL